jgi:hypothetical protein
MRSIHGQQIPDNSPILQGQAWGTMMQQELHHWYAWMIQLRPMPFSRDIDFHRIGQLVNQLNTELAQAMPVELCPCHDANCPNCHGDGWVSMKSLRGETPESPEVSETLPLRYSPSEHPESPGWKLVRRAS